MQLAPARLDEDVLESYIGGEIVVSTNSNGHLLFRGTFLKFAPKEAWVSIQLTCREYGVGDLDSIDQVVWQQSTDSATYVMLIAQMRVDEAGVLVFTERSPQGTTAIIMPPNNTSRS